MLTRADFSNLFKRAPQPMGIPQGYSVRERQNFQNHAKLPGYVLAAVTVNKSMHDMNSLITKQAEPRWREPSIKWRTTSSQELLGHFAYRDGKSAVLNKVIILVKEHILDQPSLEHTHFDSHANTSFPKRQSTIFATSTCFRHPKTPR